MLTDDQMSMHGSKAESERVQDKHAARTRALRNFNLAYLILLGCRISVQGDGCNLCGRDHCGDEFIVAVLNLGLFQACSLRVVALFFRFCLRSAAVGFIRQGTQLLYPFSDLHGTTPECNDGAVLADDTCGTKLQVSAHENVAATVLMVSEPCAYLCAAQSPRLLGLCLRLLLRALPSLILAFGESSEVVPARRSTAEESASNR